LSTLYIGKSEKELIETLQEALRKNPDVKLSILTDALRGTREAPDPSSASLLAPLVEEFGADRVEIRMYHTPNLTGLRKQYIPKRINEGWGLQHMKLYGVDDEIIMSGYVKRLGVEEILTFQGKPFDRLLYEPSRSIPSFCFKRSG
jgi:CDP-diacylglycerol--glycerol-3-phosphate 3-phosphatidyltransferase